MITRDQAIVLKHGDELHRGECVETIGPRGGLKRFIERWKVNGKTKIWTSKWLNRFRTPLKHGLSKHDYLSEVNSGHFHLATECPLHNWPSWWNKEIFGVPPIGDEYGTSR